MKISRQIQALGAAVAVAAAFGSLASPALATDTALRARLLAMEVSPNLGGGTSVDATGPRAFRSVAANAPNREVAPFLFGQRIFDVVWDHEPVQHPLLDGLGPMFNRTACRECHEGNGRGVPPESTAAGPMKSMLIRLSLDGAGANGGPVPIPNYGDQLQDRSVGDVKAEGVVAITYEEIPGTFADGTPFSLRKPTVRFENLGYGQFPSGFRFSPRVAQPVIGLGLLQAIAEETLRGLADPEDSDGDGVSGRMNWVWDANAQKMAPGRFGWKANVASLRHQNAGAALGDMGLTSPVFPGNLCEEGQAACQAEARRIASVTRADTPEIAPEIFDALETYMLLLAVPRQRNADDPAVKRGQGLFRAIGCVGCHMPTMIAGKSDNSALSGQVFHPFSDLLLHDMGEGLADNRPDYAASGREWRTQPLWGIGLTEDVTGVSRHLHDGRARSLTEAILWHGGEAQQRREAFRNLSKEQREDLLAFLGSL